MIDPQKHHLFHKKICCLSANVLHRCTYDMILTKDESCVVDGLYNCLHMPIHRTAAAKQCSPIFSRPILSKSYYSARIGSLCILPWNRASITNYPYYLSVTRQIVGGYGLGPEIPHNATLSVAEIQKQAVVFWTMYRGYCGDYASTDCTGFRRSVVILDTWCVDNAFYIQEKSLVVGKSFENCCDVILISAITFKLYFTWTFVKFPII